MNAKYRSSKKCRKAGRKPRQQSAKGSRSRSRQPRRIPASEPRRALLMEVQKWLPGVMGVGGLQELLVQAVEGFATEAGLRVALCLLEEELLRRCGEHYQRLPDREATRFGSQPGVLVIGGQKVSIAKPRARYVDGRGEVLLETYERLQRPEALPRSALAKLGRWRICDWWRCSWMGWISREKC